MSAKQKLTTTVSTKGQVILPKAIRDQRHWPAGTELMVEDTPDRTRYPDAILRMVEERTADQPFQRLDEFISQDELMEWRRAYQNVAGFSQDRVNEPRTG
jgi:AbrB family looped-hinge helix DNA binding protein